MPTQGRPLGNPIQVSNTIAVDLKMTLKSKKKKDFARNTYHSVLVYKKGVKVKRLEN